MLTIKYYQLLVKFIWTQFSNINTVSFLFPLRKNNIRQFYLDFNILLNSWVFVFICIQRRITQHIHPMSKNSYKLDEPQHIFVTWNVFWIARLCDASNHGARNSHSTEQYFLHIFWISCRSVWLHRSNIQQEEIKIITLQYA